MQYIDFLNLEDVIEIHLDQITRYGGASGIRDEGALTSAIEQPRTTYQEVYLHDSIWLMGAAYIFHISQNHPFLDGNKRTALASGLVFLEMNGIEILDPAGTLYELVIGVASGKSSKQRIAEVLELLYEGNK